MYNNVMHYIDNNSSWINADKATQYIPFVSTLNSAITGIAKVAILLTKGDITKPEYYQQVP